MKIFFEIFSKTPKNLTIPYYRHFQMSKISCSATSFTVYCTVLWREEIHFSPFYEFLILKPNYWKKFEICSMHENKIFSQLYPPFLPTFPCLLTLTLLSSISTFLYPPPLPPLPPHPRLLLSLLKTWAKSVLDSTKQPLLWSAVQGCKVCNRLVTGASLPPPHLPPSSKEVNCL